MPEASAAMQLNGSRAVVTGAAGGIGLAVAHGLLQRGASVLLSDLDSQGVAATSAGLEREYSERVTHCAGNAADVNDVAAIIDTAEETFAGIDLWVANAGVFAGFGLDAEEDAWEASWNVNVMAHVRAARALVPRWLERGGDPAGCFATTASAAGLLTQLGSPTYSTTKHAAVGFAEWLSATYGDRGVQVTCLCPMGVRTAMIEGDDGQKPDAQLGRGAVTGAGEVLSPDAVASVLLDSIESGEFLALPHPEVGRMYAKKAADPDRCLTGMRRFRHNLENPG